MPTGYHQMVTRIPWEMHQELLYVSRGDDQPISYHVRLALREYLDKLAYQERCKREGNQR